MRTAAARMSRSSVLAAWCNPLTEAGWQAQACVHLTLPAHNAFPVPKRSPCARSGVPASLICVCCGVSMGRAGAGRVQYEL